MSSTINFGIDLGTTNSLIAKYIGGKIEVFKNPIGHKETLPSVVAYRKKRTLIGDKAREYLEKDSNNVAALFKRKMGTTDTYYIDNLDLALMLLTHILFLIMKMLCGYLVAEKMMVQERT